MEKIVAPRAISVVPGALSRGNYHYIQILIGPENEHFSSEKWPLKMNRLKVIRRGIWDFVLYNSIMGYLTYLMCGCVSRELLTREYDYFSSTIILFALVSIRILTWSFGLKGNCESLYMSEGMYRIILPFVCSQNLPNPSSVILVNQYRQQFYSLQLV